MANPTRTRTRLARDERREQLVDAAAAVFQGRDPAEVTFEEIADAAGVSRALVYNYFGDRNGVLEAVYRRNLRLLRERIGAVVATTRGRKALYELVRVNVEFAVENPAGLPLRRRRVDLLPPPRAGGAPGHAAWPRTSAASRILTWWPGAGCRPSTAW